MTENLAFDYDAPRFETVQPIEWDDEQIPQFWPKLGLTANTAAAIGTVFLIVSLAFLDLSAHMSAMMTMAASIPAFIAGTIAGGAALVAEHMARALYEAELSRRKQDSIWADLFDVVAVGASIASIGWMAWGAWHWRNLF